MIGQLSYRQRILVLLGLLALAVLGALALPPIPQDPGYHMFADSRSLLGIPNFNDVVSNAGFALVGIFGALMVWRERNRDTFERAADARPYLCFFFGVALVADTFSWLRLAILAVLAVDLVVKLTYEESLLQNHYPAYADYMTRTKRLIPGLY